MQMRNYEEYEDELFYLRSQNKKYEHINNELLMERNILSQKFNNATKTIENLEHKLAKEITKNNDLK